MPGSGLRFKNIVQRFLKVRMLLFCPMCSNMLTVEEGQYCYRFACNTCPYIHNITRRIACVEYTELKEVEEALGGAEAWKNAGTTEENCGSGSCDSTTAYFLQVQTRSADEPMTIFYRCCKCTHTWKV